MKTSSESQRGCADYSRLHVRVSDGFGVAGNRGGDGSSPAGRPSEEERRTKEEEQRTWEGKGQVTEWPPVM